MPGLLINTVVQNVTVNVINVIENTFQTQVESKNFYTKPINPKLFVSSSLPTDQNSVIGAKVLLNANKYGLGKWFETKDIFKNQSEKYLNFHGIGEYQIRGPANEAFSLSVSLKTKVFDPKIVNKTEAEALNLSTKILTSLAYRHLANSRGGWGNEWESALWTTSAALGSWLIWDHLDETDKTYVENMVISEANRFNEYKVPYYQDRSGKVVFPGDTKAEENAWNANVLQAALAMMPTHPNWKVWMRKNIKLILSSSARRSDLNLTVLINGKKLNEWINGSNVFENGTVVNHNRIHPDYMLALIDENLSSVTCAALAGQPVPNATFWNIDLVYSALVDLKWPSPPWAKPGGTIYVRDLSKNASSLIYYPQGDDWGTGSKLSFAELDNKIDKMTNFSKRFDANDWSRAHIEAQLALQNRFTDGHTFGSKTEFNYADREEWVAGLAANNYLTSWLMHNIKITITNDKLD